MYVYVHMSVCIRRRRGNLKEGRDKLISRVNLKETINKYKIHTITLLYVCEANIYTKYEMYIKM